jgi:4-amino-4-deoxy-L-arabinose transferase-like glycosyltransferase
MRAALGRPGERAGLVAGVGLVFAASFAARLHGLGTKPLWLDEVITFTRAGRPLHGLLLDSLRNHHLPGFFLIERAALLLAPKAAQVAALRLVPALAGAACAALVFAIAWSSGGRSGAWLAGLLMAFAPLQVAFGQEARSYTLMMAPLLLALHGLLGLARDPDAPSRRPWLSFGLGTAGALLVLPDALPWLAAATLAILAAALPRSRDRIGLLRRWVALNAALLLLVAPAYAALLLMPPQGPMAGFAWIPPPSASFLWADAASLYFMRDATMVTMRLLPPVLPGLAATMALLAVLGLWRLWRLRPARADALVLLIVWLGLPVALGVVSLVHPVLLPRYLLWSAPPFFVLAGLGIETLPPPARLAVLPAAAAMLLLNLAPYYHAETKPRWDLAAAQLAARATSGDVILASDGAAWAMLGHYDPALAPLVTQRRARAAAALAEGRPVFAVYGPAGQGVQPSPVAFAAMAAGLGPLSPPERAGTEIVIRQISPPPAARIACSSGAACR